MKKDYRILLGVAPSKRDDPGFPVSKAIPNKTALFNKLDEMSVQYVSLEGVTPDGLLVTLDDVQKAAAFFKEKGVDALFVPSATFGSEPATAFLAKEMDMPTLIWGPRDPGGNLTNGKTQIGLFPIGKSLNMVNRKFTFIPSCYIDDPMLEKGIRTFITAAQIVKAFKTARILQIGTRPETFWSCIINENELLNKFGIYVYPITISELVAKTKWHMENSKEKVQEIVDYLKANAELKCNEIVLYKSAAMKLAMREYLEISKCTGIAVQCWYAMQAELGIWPCTAGALLYEEGIPVTCETDILGTITQIIAMAAVDGRTVPHFADFINRHPVNDNVECVAHCGITPFSEIEGTPTIEKRLPPFDQNWGGGIGGKIKKAEKMSFIRFDCDNGDYKVLLGNAMSSDGPAPAQPSAYNWFEVLDWPKLETKLVYGPYTHHVAMVNEDILPAVTEALRYIDGVEADFAFEEEKAYAESYLYSK